MPRGYELNQDYAPVVSDAMLSEPLAKMVARERAILAETSKSQDGTVEVAAIVRRFRWVGSEALQIALRSANEQNLFDYDEVDGILYPPRRRPVVEPIRYM